MGLALPSSSWVEAALNPLPPLPLPHHPSPYVWGREGEKGGSEGEGEWEGGRSGEGGEREGRGREGGRVQEHGGGREGGRLIGRVHANICISRYKRTRTNFGDGVPYLL